MIGEFRGHYTRAMDGVVEAPGPKFLVDINVDRLGKWLRIMGYDALVPDDTDDGELIRIALRENRTILTRDSGIARRRVVTSGMLKAVLIHDDNVAGQVKQVVDTLGLKAQFSFSRCIRCNEALERIPREESKGKVPEYVLATQPDFMACPSCRRVYWRGTHWTNMSGELARMGALNT